MILARSGALPVGALALFLGLAVAVATLLIMERFPRAWTLYGPPKRQAQADLTEAPPPAEVLPPGPITPYVEPEPEPDQEPAERPPPGTAAAVALAHELDGNGQAGNGSGAMILPMRRSHHGAGYSKRYVAYLKGKVPGDDGIYWPDRIKPWKAEHRRNGGVCEIGRVLARGGQPNCGSREPLVHMDTDHIDYDNLYHETRKDVALGCHADHMRRETLKQAGLDIYAEWGRP